MNFKSIFIFSSFLFCFVAAKKHDCEWSDWLETPSCPAGRNAIYWDEEDGQFVSRCCKSGSEGETSEKEKLKSCRTTSCTPTSASGGDLCKTMDPRFVSGKQIEYVETVRDDCLQDDGDDSPGVGALCCPAGSKDIPLTTLLGAEKHEFPHFARLETNFKGAIHSCGGSVYNERFIITASHCVTDKAKFETYNPKLSTIYLDIEIHGMKSANTYNVSKFHVHPKSTRLQKKAGPAGLIYDIAIVELDEDIRFGKHVKAIPIAEPGLDPLKYSDHTLIIGFGMTDTGSASKKLQKADAVLRSNEREIGADDAPYPELADYSDQFMFLGGYQDGIASPGSGRGDSGGPAICRSEGGEAVLCGLDSKGISNVEDCDKYKDEANCYPTAWVRVEHFHDWIVSVAGDQSKADVMREPLYGKYTRKGEYENQVHIEAADGHICGGTLVSQSNVVTAAHCVVTEDGKPRKGLKVTAGIRNLDEVKNGQTLDVASVKVLDGFKRKGKKVRGKRIAVYAANATFTDPYFKNDLAVVTLNGQVNIGQDKIAKVSKAHPHGEKSFWAKEVAFRTEKKRYGYLSKRDFHILGHTDCQNRLDRLSSIGYDIKLDKNVLCGVEKYSGGSLCDRELGGGLFCENDNGEEELCGVQTFRLCEFSVPSAFLNVGKYNDFIQSAIQS
ncbi:unnamed protein product [Orchesella dallaii]|uniref:Peptidase S1 domain-containing protein n=1 Tax=Orchesella dallaii TaxID=48710 RepID=A0ABP1RQY6_9HEXA